MPNLEIQKDLLIKRFKKSIKTYDDNAVVQKDIVDILISILKEYIDIEDLKRVFEIGAGTGFLTKSLLKEFGNNNIDYFINDIIDDYKILYQQMNYNFKDYFMGDVQLIDYPKNLDLIISSNTFQWIENKDTTLNKINNSLSNEGFFLMSSFSKENLKEIREITGLGLNYLTKENAEKLISKNFILIYSEERIIEMEFDTPMQILFHIKSTGVNSLNNIFWKKSDMENFCNEYKYKFSNNNGKVKLTYNPTFYLAKKK